MYQILRLTKFNGRLFYHNWSDTTSCNQRELTGPEDIHHIIQDTNKVETKIEKTNLFDFLQKRLNITTNWWSGSCDPHRAHLN